MLAATAPTKPNERAAHLAELAHLASYRALNACEDSGKDAVLTAFLQAVKEVLHQTELASRGRFTSEMASAVLFERHPLERTVRWRIVANELSMTLVVRRCFHRTHARTTRAYWKPFRGIVPTARAGGEAVVVGDDGVAVFDALHRRRRVLAHSRGKSVSGRALWRLIHARNRSLRLSVIYVKDEQKHFGEG